MEIEVSLLSVRNNTTIKCEGTDVEIHAFLMCVAVSVIFLPADGEKAVDELCLRNSAGQRAELNSVTKGLFPDSIRNRDPTIPAGT